GDSDLVVVVHGEKAALLRNDGGNRQPSVLIRLRQPEGNRFAIGARVEIGAGEHVASDSIGTQGSYLSQHAVGEVAFGLGAAGMVARITVTWPDGETESAGPFLAPSIVDWTRGSAPGVRSFPGRHDSDAKGPADVEAKREFYELRKVAQAARLAGDWTGAVDGYAAALRLWPGHGDCLYYLGNSWLELEQDAAALSAFERMVEFEPQSNQGWMQIGFLRLPGGDRALDDLDAAQAAFERCHELNSEESRPIEMLGVVAMLKGELDLAAENLAAAARLNPRSVPARWFGGRVALLRGDKETAQRLLDEAREAARAAGGGSVSNEGDTASGRAMTSGGGARLDQVLERWRGVLEREPSSLSNEFMIW
ncbi:MAG: ASPIC/UnbV domain-containing protein, partial [Planctomycetes bacterium]|nr:ASPIC/UnbV domain-containing protein [Planctomycetota bacterium]